jgi:SOS-response transcriptional repressor LexA
MTTLARGAEKRDEILRFIKGFIADGGVSPTLTEIADGVQLKSPSNVRSHLLMLKAEGKITMQDGKFRTIRVL